MQPFVNMNKRLIGSSRIVHKFDRKPRYVKHAKALTADTEPDTKHEVQQEIGGEHNGVVGQNL